MTKRRALVLSDESARHPFLRSLPAHVRKIAAGKSKRAWRDALDRGDWRDFLGAYCASFVIVSAFIA